MWPNRTWKRAPIKRGVYAVLHTASGRAYVGASENLRARLLQHRWTLNHRQSPHPILQEAWDTFGADAFDLQILEEIPSGVSLFPTEQMWIDRFNAGPGSFNALPLAGTSLGGKRPDASARRGAANPNGKLTDDDIATILARLDAGETGVALAREYRVGTATICRVRRGHRTPAASF